MNKLDKHMNGHFDGMKILYQDPISTLGAWIDANKISEKKLTKYYPMISIIGITV